VGIVERTLAINQPTGRGNKTAQTTGSAVGSRHFKALRGGSPNRRLSLNCGLCFLAISLVWHPAHAEPLTIIESRESLRFDAEDYPQPIQLGDTIQAPTRFRTRFQGYLLLGNAETRIQMPEFSTVVVENVTQTHVRNTSSELATPRLLLRRRKDDSTLNLRLTYGTILITNSAHPVCLTVEGIIVNATNATFAVSTSPSKGERISVLNGQLKVRNQDSSVTILTPGNCLKRPSDKKTVVTRLDDPADSHSHLRTLCDFSHGTEVSQSVP
jgi:hypothetical protein